MSAAPAFSHPCPAPDRHQAAPDTTLSPRDGVSNTELNEPLGSRTRAHRTPTLTRQIQADLTERRGAPKARALAKLRYSPCPRKSSGPGGERWLDGTEVRSCAGGTRRRR